jgi:hypothetical protein
LVHNEGGFKGIRHETDLRLILVMMWGKKYIYMYIYMISEHILTPFDEELGPVTRCNGTCGWDRSGMYISLKDKVVFSLHVHNIALNTARS